MSDEPTNPEPEVYKEVLKQIETIGASSKENHELLNKSFKELKTELEKTGTVDRGKISKLQEDIVTRQEGIDNANKQMTKRMDDLEIAMKRPGGIITETSGKDIQEALDFHLLCKSLKGEKFGPRERANFEPDLSVVKEYKKLMPEWLRSDDKYMNETEKKALSVGVDPDGGFTVTPEMSARIITRIFESDPIRQMATVETISTDAIEFPVDFDEFESGWVGETQSRPVTTNAQRDKKRIVVHEMYSKPKATQQLIEDSAMNIENWIANRVADKFMRFEAAAFVTGDGIGKPRGFLTIANGTNYGQVEQVNMGKAAAITADGFINVKYALTEFYLNRGTWLMNRLTVRDTMQLKDGNGNYLWKPAIAVDAPSTILSLPVRMSTTMPIVAANTLSVAIADWAQAYTIVDRLGITILRDPFSDKPFVEFYTRKRVGGDVVNHEAIKIGKIAV